MSEPGTATEEVRTGNSALRRLRDQSGRNMALSLALLLVPILLIGAALRACGSSDPTVIDPASAISNARAAALFPIVVPQGLGDEWKTVSATFRRTDDGTAGTLRLGYLTPSEGQVLFIASNEPVAGLLTRELGQQVRPQGEITIEGQAWASSIVRGDERALVQTDAVRTLVVVGRTSVDELTALAASLG